MMVKRISNDVAVSRQADLFLADEPELLQDQPERVFRPTPEDVRNELLALLAKARAAHTMPWPAREAGMWQVVFPQMTNWLPPDEGDQLRFEFAQEMQRLAKAA